MEVSVELALAAAVGIPILVLVLGLVGFARIQAGLRPLVKTLTEFALLKDQVGRQERRLGSLEDSREKIYERIKDASVDVRKEIEVASKESREAHEKLRVICQENRDDIKEIKGYVKAREGLLK